MDKTPASSPDRARRSPHCDTASSTDLPTQVPQLKDAPSISAGPDSLPSGKLHAEGNGTLDIIYQHIAREVRGQGLRAMECCHLPHQASLVYTGYGTLYSTGCTNCGGRGHGLTAEPGSASDERNGQTVPSRRNVCSWTAVVEPSSQII